LAESEFWDTFYTSMGAREQSPFTAAMHDKLFEMLPEGVESILDAGCGGGALMAKLARVGKYRVEGMDMSEIGVRTVRQQLGMQARVGSVVEMSDFADASFDLVICSEVIEHLKEEEIPRCISEITRVARRWVITTNPCQEDLGYHAVVCDRCKTRFHAVGHINTVDETFLRHHLGSRVRSLAIEYSGKREWRSAIFADWMRRSGHNVIEPSDAVCPLCEHRIEYKARRIGPRLIFAGYRVVQRTLRSMGVSTSANILALAEV
jgi:ubiquinone/menaquinone biosynthesis C-methylase UbiE